MSAIENCCSIIAHLKAKIFCSMTTVRHGKEQVLRWIIAATNKEIKINVMGRFKPDNFNFVKSVLSNKGPNKCPDGMEDLSTPMQSKVIAIIAETGYLH